MYIDSLNHPSTYDENTTTIPFSQIRDQSNEVKSLVQHRATRGMCASAPGILLNHYCY